MADPNTTLSTLTTLPSDPPSKAERARERIVEAAAEVFLKRGYALARLVDIAELAGLQTGSLYYHFKDRADLVEEVIRRGLTDTLAQVKDIVAALPPGTSPRDRLDAAVRGHAETVFRRPSTTPAAMRLITQIPPELIDAFDFSSIVDFWTRLIQEAQDAGDVRVDAEAPLLAAFLQLSINAMVPWRVGGPSPDARQRALMCSILLNGMRTTSGPEISATPVQTAEAL